MWTSRYRSPHPNEWQVHPHVEAHRFYPDQIQFVDLQNSFHFPENTFGLVGFACDEDVRRHYGRIGAAHGPAAFRAALGNLPLVQPINLCDVGTVTCTDGHLEAAQEALGQVVALLLGKGAFPLVVGGGCETALGAFQGMPKRCVYIHFGAQLPSLESLESVDCTCLGIQRFFHPPSLLKQAQDLKIGLFSAEEFHEGGSELSLDVIDDILARANTVFVSIDLDVFAAPFAPGVSTPQVMGLLPWHVLPALQRLASSGKMVGISINELSPPLDRDGLTAQLAAQLAMHYFGERVKS